LLKSIGVAGAAAAGAGHINIAAAQEAAPQPLNRAGRSYVQFVRYRSMPLMPQSELSSTL
jgi:hypothetical protein